MNWVGEVISKELKAFGMTQLQLAEKSHLTAAHISWIINGRCKITVDTASKIASALPALSARELLIIQLDYELEKYEKETELIHQRFQ